MEPTECPECGMEAQIVTGEDGVSEGYCETCGHIWEEGDEQ